jgi:hypothetical protein
MGGAALCWQTRHLGGRLYIGLPLTTRPKRDPDQPVLIHREPISRASVEYSPGVQRQDRSLPWREDSSRVSSRSTGFSKEAMPLASKHLGPHPRDAQPCWKSRMNGSRQFRQPARGISPTSTSTRTRALLTTGCPRVTLTPPPPTNPQPTTTTTTPPVQMLHDTTSLSANGSTRSHSSHRGPVIRQAMLYTALPHYPSQPP